MDQLDFLNPVPPRPKPQPPPEKLPTLPYNFRPVPAIIIKTDKVTTWSLNK